MPRFIPITVFSDQSDGLDLYTDEGIETFKERINDPSVVQQLISEGFTHEDLTYFNRSLNWSGTVLFHSWITQNEPLLHLLEKGSVKEMFRDGAKNLEHKYASSYRAFLTPYLIEILIGHPVNDDSELLKLFSFTKLLSGDDRPLVESQLFKSISKRLRILDAESLDLEEEQDLIDMVKPMCSDDLINCINELSKASYALKLDYVDTILNTIKTRSCTVRFANWVLKQMERVQLNKEHENKIASFRKDLADGTFQVRNKGKAGSPMSWRPFISIGIFLILGATAFYLIYFKPFNEVPEPEFEDTSSFTQFTKAERQQIDSLIQTMSKHLIPDQDEVDPGIPIGGGTTLSLRKGFRNDLMEKIYNDLSKDATLKLNHGIDSCESKSEKYHRYRDVKSIDGRNGKVEAMLRNESDYDVIIYLSDNKKSGSVYSAFLKKGETKIFTITRGDVITLVAGNNYMEYSAPGQLNSGEILPSSDYTHHFCKTDVNFEESMNTSYQYVDSGRKRSKFMIMGGHGTYFKLIDIHNVLSPY